MCWTNYILRVKFKQMYRIFVILVLRGNFDTLTLTMISITVMFKKFSWASRQNISKIQ